MSHAATNWAITQRGLKPASKMVLWHLCDRHNPDLGCFPSQDKLAYDCEMSRSALNEHLKLLEQAGLIRREQQINKHTRQQENTRYRFPFEADFIAAPHVVAPSPESGHGAVSGKSQIPCPENGQSRVRNRDTNPVREPVIEPPGGADAREMRDFNILWDSWPEQSRPDNREVAAKLFCKLEPDVRAKVLGAAKVYRKAMVYRGKPARMILFLRERLWVEFDGAPPIDSDGDFYITPDRPEWGEWLGSIRRQYGEASVQSAARHKFMKRKMRWPGDLSLAKRVTNLATYGAELDTASEDRY